MDRPELADFLRRRREALQPEDVGLFRGPRRRTSGLRREEVAELCGMSTDYYARLERGNGPQPSEQMAAALARGLRLSLAERDHLFLLTGHNAPQRTLRSDHVSPGLMRVLDRLEDTPAQIMSGLGETLVQTRLARALLGDQTQFTGLARSVVYRWFADPASRLIYPEEDHPAHGRIYTAQLRRVVTQQDPKSPAAALANTLLGQSAEFAALWSDHEIGIEYTVTADARSVGAAGNGLGRRVPSPVRSDEPAAADRSPVTARWRGTARSRVGGRLPGVTRPEFLEATHACPPEHRDAVRPSRFSSTSRLTFGRRPASAH